MQVLAVYSSQELLERLIECGALDLVMITYDEDSVMALKNFCLRSPSLTDYIFIDFGYKLKFDQISMAPKNILDVVGTIMLLLPRDRLTEVTDLVWATFKDFTTAFEEYL